MERHEHPRLTMKAALIKRLFQKDNHTFVIEWSDGKVHTYRLHDLQAACPCARCQTSKPSPDTLQKEVKAIRITSVGRYALRIHFTSGCSSGIYGFDFLRILGGVDKG